MKTAPHNKPSPVPEGTVCPHCHPPPRPSTTGWSHRQEPSASGSLLVPPLEAPVGQMQAGSKFTSLFLGFDPLVHRSISVKRAPNGWSGGARHGNDSRTHADAHPSPTASCPACHVRGVLTLPIPRPGDTDEPSSRRRKVRFRRGIWCFQLPGTECFLCGTGAVTHRTW